MTRRLKHDWIQVALCTSVNPRFSGTKQVISSLTRAFGYEGLNLFFEYIHGPL